MQELSSLLHYKTSSYIVQQESNSTKIIPPNSSLNYTAVRNDRLGDTSGGGLVTFIHPSIPFINLPSDLFFPSDAITEHLSITATTNNVLVNIHNIYILPISKCPLDFTLNLHLLVNFHDNNIIMRHFKAHSPAWYFCTASTLAEARGTLITESVTNCDLILLNIDSPTRVPSRGTPPHPTSQ